MNLALQADCKSQQGPRDIVLLTVLGGGCRTEIVSMVKGLPPNEWHPTDAVIGSYIPSAVELNLLRTVQCEKTATNLRHEITDQGLATFIDLLRRSVPSLWGDPSRTCVAAKLCHLDCRNSEERSREVDALSHMYRDTLCKLRRRYSAAAPPPLFTNR